VHTWNNRPAAHTRPFCVLLWTVDLSKRKVPHHTPILAKNLLFFSWRRMQHSTTPADDILDKVKSFAVFPLPAQAHAELMFNTNRK
jgi:hypothetical protein